MNARLADPSGVSLYQIRQIRLAATRAENELKCMGASGVKLEHGHYEATYPPAQSEVTG